jgi:hypothetical protein
MNNLNLSNAITRELPLMVFIGRRTWIFLNIEPAATVGVGFQAPGDRIKYWAEIGVFFGGILGMFCGFVLSFVTRLGQLPMDEMVACWAVMGVVVAMLAGGLGALCSKLYCLGFSTSFSLNRDQPQIRRGERPMVAAILPGSF